MATAHDTGVPIRPVTTPDTIQQIRKLTRYQFFEYVRSRRFVAMLGIVAIIGAILTGLVGYYRGGLISSTAAFYGSFWGGGAAFVVVLVAVIFGGDAIAGEFQNKTGYFLMGLPVRRATIYIGKFFAAFLASAAVLGLFLLILLGNGVFYFGSGALPWQLPVSLVISLVYLAAVLGTTFLFSSLFKVSAYGFALTAVLFLIGFGILQALLVDLVHIEPWMVISYASSSIGTVFNPTVNWGLFGTITSSTTHFGRQIVTVTTYTAGIAESLVIMIGYLLLTAAGGLYLFEREEFT
ncbi:MAG: ABC transporter permease [Thermoplasmata archaeon]